MRSSPVFIISGLGRNFSTLNDFLERLNLYGSRVAKRSNNELAGLVIIILAGAKLDTEITRMNFPFIKVVRISKNRLSPPLGIIQIVRILKDLKLTNSTLVAGDLFLDLFLCIQIKKYFLPNSRIQISFHGDFMAESKGIKKAVKYMIGISLFRSADSFRAVSLHLKDQNVKRFHLDNKRFLIAPIPIPIPIQNATAKISRQLSVGLVGRLHQERGITEAIEIFKKLIVKVPEIKYHVVGDGPMKSDFEKFNKSSSDFKDAHLYGKVSSHQLSLIWPNIHVLLSSAPLEGYGLTIREALLNSTFVVARSNDGTILAKNSLAYGIALYTEVDEAVSLISAFLKENFRQDKLLELQQKIAQLNDESLNGIIDSWIP